MPISYDAREHADARVRRSTIIALALLLGILTAPQAMAASHGKHHLKRMNPTGWTKPSY